MKLVDEVNSLAMMYVRSKTCVTRVEFRYDSNIECKKINKAINFLPGEEKLDLTERLLCEWVSFDDSRCVPIFGMSYKTKKGLLASSFVRNTLFTVGHQLRLWYGHPHSVRFDYVDSMGGNLLLNIFGTERFYLEHNVVERIGSYASSEIFVPESTK